MRRLPSAACVRTIGLNSCTLPALETLCQPVHLSFEKGDLMVTVDENRVHWLHTRMDGADAKKEKLPDPPEFHLQSRPFYQNVFAAIRGEESLIVAPEQSRRYVATAAAIISASASSTSPSTASHISWAV